MCPQVNIIQLILDKVMWIMDKIFKYSNLQLGIGKDNRDCFDLPEISVDFGKNIAAYYFWLLPNMMFNFYPWGLSINIVIPISAEKTKIMCNGNSAGITGEIKVKDQVLKTVDSFKYLGAIIQKSNDRKPVLTHYVKDVA